MIDHELTDPTGSALTITHNVDGVWVTATDTRDEVTVGPFPVTSLTEAVTVESDAEVSGDLMDGGVTAAAIEAEVVSPERARSLVQENTELRARIGRVEEARDLYRRDVLTEERHRGEARRFALAWKETARHLLGSREVVRLACDLETARADSAEENVRAREEMINRLAARAENPRPLTANDITDEMVERGAERFRGLPTAMSAHARVRTIIRAALTPPPTRPEGAEGVDEVLRTFPGTLAGIRDISDHLASHGVRAGGDS